MVSINPIPAMHMANVTLYRKSGQKSEKNVHMFKKNCNNVVEFGDALRALAVPGKEMP